MALITKFEEGVEVNRIHDEVSRCEYGTKRINGQIILQIDTYGRPSRENKNSVSQTIQLNIESSREFKKILEQAFSGI